MMTIGLNNGIDFTGGRNYVIRFNQEVKTDDVRNMLDAQLDGSVSVIQIGTADQVRVSTNYKIEDNDPTVDQEIENKLFEGVKSLLLEGTTLDEFTTTFIQSSQKVGPSMADDIKNSAILAVIFAMICMAAYILLRFRDVSFSVGAFAFCCYDYIVYHFFLYLVMEGSSVLNGGRPDVYRSYLDDYRLLYQ